MTIMLIAATLAAAQRPIPSAPVPPPVIDMSPLLPRPVQQQLLRWRMSPVLCRGDGGEAVAQPVVMASDPQPVLTWLFPAAKRTITFDFRIDSSGRPLSIARVGTGYVADADDVTPALVASRFAAGAERRGCTATFTASVTSIAAAPVADVMAYSVFAAATPVKAVWDRLRPPGSTCTDPSPEVLLRAFPAFRTLPDQPGYRTWSMTGYDLDASGRPRDVHTVAGSGTASLDRAARDAAARSRFERGVRVGCLYPYYKGPAILPAPLPPEEDAVRPVNATCPRQHAWNRAPVLAYPAPYRRRSIEGWAMVAYDVAPWGQTGNIRVLQAEPSGDFGDAAAAMIRNAALAPSGTGYVGCIDRVRYLIHQPGMPSPAGDPTPGAVD